MSDPVSSQPEDKNNQSSVLEESPLKIEKDQPFNMRKRLFTILLFVVLIGGVFYGLYWWLIGSQRVSTDDAYVGAEIAQVTPSFGGVIRDIKVVDTQAVQAGDILVQLDDTDARLALARAQAEQAANQTNLVKATADLKRRQDLFKKGYVSVEEMTNIENAYKVAEANLAVSQVASNQAQINLNRTVIRAPISGVIARRQVQLGQRVEAGMPLMSIVPLEHVHVDANFKESQLRKIMIGQPAKLVSDLYGDDVIYHGHVIGLPGGTGSVFSLIPAQNATGNWIKVVQRLPVRIDINSEELKLHPLQVGLSMHVTVDVSSYTKKNK